MNLSRFYGLSSKQVVSAHRYFSVSCKTRASTNAEVGFIGLGNMGLPMASNLLKKGYKLTVFDTNSAVVKTLGTSVRSVSSPKEVAEKASQIVTMLPNSANVEECYAGNTGIFQSMNEGSILIDCSTISPDVSKKMDAMAKSKGSSYLDAPVSGGVNAAKGATLTFMVGGEPEYFKVAQQLLSCMGKNIVHCGSAGSGQAAKICNNMLLAITMIGTAETFNLGMKLGLDAKLLASIINTSSGRCWSSDTYNPVPGVIPNVPSANNYNGGFGTRLMTKDLGLAQDAATQTQSPTPLGSLSHQIYRIMSSSELGEKDFSVILKFLQENK